MLYSVKKGRVFTRPFCFNVMMKLCLFILLIKLSISLNAQNLVSDPGFETTRDTNVCFGGIDTSVANQTSSYFRFPKVLKYWHSPSYGLSGYVNQECLRNHPGSVTGDPAFEWGAKNPLEGDAYAQIVCYLGNVGANSDTLINNTRTYVQTRLLKPLKQGAHYKVSFFVSPTYNVKPSDDNYYYAISNFGAYLSANRPTRFNNPNLDTNTVIRVNPQIQNHSDSILSDTSRWYKICGVFQASGSEEWLTIGNFSPDTATNLQLLHSASVSGIVTFASYYFIDLVSVEEINNINPSESNDTVVCSTNSFTKTLTARSGANFYNWSTGDTTENITVDSVGTYWLEADYGCGVESDTFKIILQDSLSLQLGADTSLCETVDSIQINAPLSFNRYRWSTGDTTASIWAKQSGTYTLEAAYLCDTLQDSIKVTFNPQPPPPLISDTGFCLGDTIQLNAQGQNLLWYDSIQDQSPKTSAPWLYNTSVRTKQFWVSQSINNCESDLTSFIVKTEKPTSVFLGSDTTLCGEDSLEIGQAIDSSWKYLWNTGDTTSKIYAKNSGIYWLRASNLCNTSSDTVQVNFNPIPSPPQVQNLSYCDTVSLNTDSLKVNGQNLLWYKSTSDSLGKTNAPIPQALEAGTYRFFVSQTINSCESEKVSFELTVLSKPELSLIPNQTLCEGEMIQLNTYFPTATYQWNTGDTTANISVTRTGTYAVSLSNQCGTTQDSVQLNFENCETKIFIPNVFSPNGDGINDIFQPEGENFQLTQMQIYNRWGEQIYRSNTPYWDGRIKGKKAQTGVYFYLISYKDASGVQKQLKGTVSVVY